MKTAVFLDIDGTVFRPGKNENIGDYLLLGILKSKDAVRMWGVNTLTNLFINFPALIESYLVKKILRTEYNVHSKVFSKMVKGLDEKLEKFLRIGGVKLEKDIEKEFLRKVLKEDIDVYFLSAEPLEVQKFLANYLEIKFKGYYQAFSINEKISTLLNVSKEYDKVIWVDNKSPSNFSNIICLKSIYELPKCV